MIKKINLQRNAARSDPDDGSADNEPEAVVRTRPDLATFEITARAAAPRASEALAHIERYVERTRARLPDGASVAASGVIINPIADTEVEDDPEKMLNQMLLDMQGQLVEAKKQVAVAIADEKRLQKQFEQERALAIEWDKKALLAVEADNEVLAKQALLRKSEHQQLAVGYEAQWKGQASSVVELKAALAKLNGVIEEAKRKKNLLVARAKRAEAQRTILETLDGMNSSRFEDAMRSMEERVSAHENPTRSSTETVASFWRASLRRVVRRVERRIRAVEESVLIDPIPPRPQVVVLTLRVVLSLPDVDPLVRARAIAAVNDAVRLEPVVGVVVTHAPPSFSVCDVEPWQVPLGAGTITQQSIDSEAVELRRSAASSSGLHIR